MEHNPNLDDEVTLVADDRRFKCNRGKLIASSDYFRAMFTSNFAEKDKEIILLQDVDAESLDILLHYVHLGTYSISDDNVLGLLQTASMLQFTDVQKACEKVVCETLSNESCLDIYSVTSPLGLSQIAIAARSIALWNFQKISAMPQYLQLTLDALVEYISDPGLFTGSGGEWIVWEAITRWIEENEVERASHIMHLMHCLDFKALTIDDISNMLFYTIVSENDEVVELLECIKRYKNDPSLLVNHSVKGKLQAHYSSDDTQRASELKLEKHRDFFVNCLSRKPPHVPSVVGFKRLQLKQPKKAKNSDDEEDQVDYKSSRQNSELVPVLYTFNPITGKVAEEFSLTKLCNGPVICSGFQVCSVGPSVYILGGEFLYGHGNWNDSLWRYSTATKKWIIENSLPEPRRHHLICAVENIIYILGGLGRHRIVQSSVKAYDTESGEWLSCPDMPHTVSNGAVCAFKGRLMVFTHEMQLLTYYPSMRKWSAIPVRSPTKHGYRAALPWRNHIYLIDNCSNKVFKYSMETQNMQEYGSFPSPPVNVCIADGKLYNFSHDDLDEHVIEVLDIVDNDKDTVKDSLSQGDLGGPLSVYGNSKMDMETDNSEKKKDSIDVSCKDKHFSVFKNIDKSPIIVAKEIWRERDNGPHIFTTKYPADTTYSLGCFPLRKLM